MPRKEVSITQQQVYGLKNKFSSYLEVGVVDMFEDQSGCSGLKRQRLHLIWCSLSQQYLP